MPEEFISLISSTGGVAAGFSGHGFMIAPAVALITSDVLAGERDPVLDILGADRFAAGLLVTEPQLV